jgi:DNA-binding transcriptional MocR family regulator
MLDAERHAAPVDALTREADVSLAQHLSARYADRNQQRLRAPGARLPSVRECAGRLGVSPTTVVVAYDQLLAHGFVEARRRRGFFVREIAATDTARPLAAEPRSSARTTHFPLPVRATTLMRGMFQTPGSHPMPGLGTLPVDWLDQGLLATALRRVCSGAALAATSLHYGEPAGHSRLRNALCTRLADHDVAASPQQIITTIGATQALDVATRTLLRAGDAVLVDEPGWSVEYARLAALGMRVLPVPRGEDGPDLAVMQRLIEAQKPHERPRLYVTVSVLHNPTGASL